MVITTAITRQHRSPGVQGPSAFPACFPGTSTASPGATPSGPPFLCIMIPGLLRRSGPLPNAPSVSS